MTKIRQSRLWSYNELLNIWRLKLYGKHHKDIAETFGVEKRDINYACARFHITRARKHEFLKFLHGAKK